MEENKINLTKKIEEKIEKDDVKMRSKWFFIAEKLGLESGLALSIILAIFLVSLSLYIMQQNGAFEFMEFGFKGLPVILASVPYEIIILAVGFFVLANYIIKQFDFSYKRPFYIFSCMAIFLISVIAVIMTATGASKAVVEKTASSQPIKDFYNKKMISFPPEQKALIGRIVGFNGNMLTIINPQGKIIQIKISPQSDMPDPKISQGQVVKIIGRRENDIFRAHFIRVIRPNPHLYFKLVPLSVPSPEATNEN